MRKTLINEKLFRCRLDFNSSINDDYGRGVMKTNYLKSSSERIGQLYPIVVDFFGNIIDGKHRFDANKKWKKVKMENIRTEKDLLIARLVSNIVRRRVPSQEKKKMLERLGKIYQREGVEPGRIAYKIADQTGMSYTWVTKYLPQKLKNNLQSNRRAGSVTHHVTKIWRELLTPPKKKDALTIKNYGNTTYVSLLLDKDFYSEFERNSLEVGVPPELSVLKALEELNEKMKKAIVFKNRKKPIVSCARN